MTRQAGKRRTGHHIGAIPAEAAQLAACTNQQPINHTPSTERSKIKRVSRRTTSRPETKAKAKTAREGERTVEAVVGGESGAREGGEESENEAGAEKEESARAGHSCEMRIQKAKKKMKKGRTPPKGVASSFLYQH